MVDSIKDLTSLVSILQTVGPIGLLIFIYWSDQRTIRRIQEEADKKFDAMQKMYEANVLLVKNYEGIARDMSGMITLSTQHLTRIEDKIDANQFCPEARIRKTVREDV